MLERIHITGRTIQASLLIAGLVLACHGAETAAQPERGRLEIVAEAQCGGSGAGDDGALTGQLELRGVSAGAASVVSIAGVSPGSRLQHELPPGLYSLTWQSDTRPLFGAALLRAPLVAVQADRVTRLMLRQAPTESADSGAANAAAAPACRS
jgi:hypothetical protein